MTGAELREAAERVANAALPWMAPDEATEVANNLAQGLGYEPEADPKDAATRLLRHRVQHFALRVGDIEACAACMARAWNQAAGQEERAA